jgi:anti-sigma regulatory factor (Ser/Thr protein kinase)
VSDSTGALTPPVPPHLAGTPGAARGTGVPAALTPGTSGRPPPLPPPPRHGTVVAGRWPYRDAIELGPLPGAVPCARLHVRHVLWEWGLTALSENAELLVSELMTNAVAATRAMDQPLPVRLWLLADPPRILVLAWDASLQPPVPEAASQDAENGRGLMLIQAVSQHWDWYYPPETGGKIVWALSGE